MKMYRITEKISWDKRVEFTFKGFGDLANKLRMFRDLMKLHSGREYRVLIEEIV